MQTRTAPGLGQFIWLAVESFNNLVLSALLQYCSSVSFSCFLSVLGGRGNAQNYLFKLNMYPPLNHLAPVLVALNLHFSFVINSMAQIQ